MRVRNAVVAVCAASAGASASIDGPEVILSNIPSSSTSLVDGALGPGGSPEVAHYGELLGLSVSPSGDFWTVHALTDQPDDRNQVLVFGYADGASVLAQEGQPVASGGPGEVYDFFDTDAGVRDDSVVAFGARARGGSPNLAEKVILITSDGVLSTMVVQQGDGAIGLIDANPNPSGDEIFGSSLNSVHMLNDSRVGFAAMDIENIDPSRRPAIFYESESFRQAGVSTLIRSPRRVTDLGGVRSELLLHESGRSPLAGSRDLL